jgi:hypothetical protein
MRKAKKLAYIAGPMRGLPLYNFPAFDAAASRYRGAGWEVINPAEMDRSRGFSEHNDKPSPEFLKQAIMDDLLAISECDALALLPGWRESLGAQAEVALARFLGLPLLCAETFAVIED